MSYRNRIHNSTNPYQGKYLKILCVCSAGLLRSPTAALVLGAEPFNHNTRAAGLEADFALIVVDEVLLSWCDEVVCMTQEQANELAMLTDKPIKCLDIADSYNYRDPDLMRMITESYPSTLPIPSNKLGLPETFTEEPK